MFDWSLWIFGALALYCVCVVAGFIIAFITAFVHDDFDDEPQSDRYVLFKAVFFSVALMVTVNVISYNAQDDDVVDNGHYAAKYFGLESNRDYPLIVGSRVGGVHAEASADGGLFSAQASVSAKPASILSVSYTHQDVSYILELPVSLVKFVQTEDAEPSVRLRLTTDSVAGFTTTKRFSACEFIIHNLIADCKREQLGTNTNASQRADDRGLAPIVAQNLDSAVITLTPTMYKEILGTP